MARIASPDFPIQENEIWIPGHVPSSKNSKRIVRTKSGVPMLIDSKQTAEYYKAITPIWILSKRKFLSLIEHKIKPYKIGMYFVRNDRRLFDYINPAQTVQDVMVKAGWIEDDNCDEMIPVFDGHHVDKSQSGVVIRVY